MGYMDYSGPCSCHEYEARMLNHLRALERDLDGMTTDEVRVRLCQIIERKGSPGSASERYSAQNRDWGTEERWDIKP